MVNSPRIRSEKEILEEVKNLAVEYYELTRKPLGVTGEIAEFIAAETLGLTLCEARSEGFDAFGAEQQKIQIKGRRVGSSGKWGRVPSINTDKEFDSVQLVLMDANYNLLEIWEANRGVVIKVLDEPGSRARNERRSMAVSKFKQIASRLYPVLSEQIIDRKVCPECGHIFQGIGWGGLDAHWRSKHNKINSYNKVKHLIMNDRYKN